MSWQAYVDSNLVGTGKVSKAAIIGQQGGIWAASAGLSLSEAEQKAIIAAHKKPDETQTSGIRLEEKKYFTISADERSINGKKGGDGCVLVKTKQAILVGIYNAPIQQTEATTIVEKLADYLIDAGY